MAEATKNIEEVKANHPIEASKTASNRVETKPSSNTTDQQSKSSASIKPVNPPDNKKAQQAFGFLRNVDNGELYGIYKKLIAQASNDPNVKKYLPYAIKLLNLPSYNLPDKNITVNYNNEHITVNEGYFPKTMDEASILATAYLLHYAFSNDARDYTTLLIGFTNALSNLRDSMVALSNLNSNAGVRNALQEFVSVLDGYIKSWSQFKSEYPDPDKLKEEVVKMATADATQTGGQAGSIFGNLLDAVYGILGSIVDALKNYATEIAEVLVAGMLGYSVIRYGRQMINGLVNMVSTLF